jgi:hypothetical protein
MMLDARLGPGAQLVSDHLRLFPYMRSGAGDRNFEISPNPSAAELRLLPRSMAQYFCQNLGWWRECSILR